MIFLSLILSLSTAFAETQTEANLNYCTERVNSGNYRSAGDQVYCHKYFDIAPAYLIKCLSFENNEYPSELDEKACSLYLSNLKDWGPWQDYTPPKELIHLITAHQVPEEDSYIVSASIK